MKKIILLLVLFNVLPISSQSVSQEQAEVFFISLIISDMPTSEKWYNEILGFEVISQADQFAERGFKITNMKRAEMQIELIQLNSAITKEDLALKFPDQNRIAGFFKVGFRISNFDKWINELSEKGLDMSNEVVVNPETSKRMVVITDPDKNRIQLFEN